MTSYLTVDDPDLNMAEAEETRTAMDYGYPEQEEKHNLIAFFREIIRNDMNIKTGNLSDPELGVARLPVRTNLELANYCAIMGMGGMGLAFMDDAQVLLGTSLSREGFLAKLAVTTQKFSETSLKKSLGGGDKKKKGMFNKKKTEEQFY